MQVSPNTVRKYTRELVSIGLVSVRRRGQGRTSLYLLHSENSVRASENALPEAQNLRREGERKNRDGGQNLEDSRANPSDVLSLDTNPVITEEARISSPLSSPVPAPLIDEARMAIFPFISDIARELHDEASLSATTTRALRVYQKANVSIEDFQDHLLYARQTTQERSASVKKTRADGVKVKVPYFFAVLEKSLFGDSQCSLSDTLPYPQSPPLTRFSPANQTNLSVQGRSDFWNRRE
jgi:hypothetical protein